MAEEQKSPSEQRTEGSWNKLKGRLREAWGSLSDDDLEKAKGEREQLVGKIQQRTGESRQKIRKRIDEIAENVKYKF